jgi:Ran GTPase-activating protein (RanGAP) involved in mRNA processing and transport
LTLNESLKVLNLGQNKLDDEGLSYIANALKMNKSLVFLDMFDANFEDEGAI